MKRTLLVVLGAASLAACAEEEIGPPPPRPPPIRQTPPPPPTPPPSYDNFRESDFTWSTGSGSGRIVGQLAFRGSCNSVILAPETPWTRARMQVLYLSDISADVPADEAKAREPPGHGNQYGRYVRQANCDPSGRFTFQALPNGAWYVVTAATPAGGGPKMAIMRRVETHGSTVQVTLR